MRIVLVTGLSGSGKSVAIRVLEDAGYYCVDNLPPQFLLELVAYLDRTAHRDVAVSVDARSEATLADVPMMISNLRASGHDVRVLFLTASDAALVQRFSETRRRHPMALRELERGGASTVTEAISLERALLEPLAEIGHSIDTSALHPNLLRHWVRQFVDLQRQSDAVVRMLLQVGIPCPPTSCLTYHCPTPYGHRRAPGPVAKSGRRSCCGACSTVSVTTSNIIKMAAYLCGGTPPYVTVAIGCTRTHRAVYAVKTSPPLPAPKPFDSPAHRPIQPTG